MIVIAIIGILAAVAIPMYTSYSMKARMGNLIAMTDSYKTAVTFCISQLGTPTGCNPGVEDIPDVPTPANYPDLNGFALANGIITVTSDLDPEPGVLDDVDYVLTPSLDGGVVRWLASGTCDDHADIILCDL